MRKITLSLFLLLFSACSFSQGDIVQGPFKIGGDDNVFIKNESDSNYPLALYFESDGKKFRVDSYEVNGSDPHVETVFFVKLKNIKNVIVLISWHQKHVAEDIDGNSYQVYGYKYQDGNLTINPLVRNDPALTGLDGEFDGEMLSFKYKDAAKIKQYLSSHYK